MHSAYMAEFHDRLKRAREAAGFETATDAAKAMGVPAPTYLSHENGSRGGKRPHTKTIRKYARRFGVNFAWLADEQGPMRGEMEAIPAPGIHPDDIGIVLQVVEQLRKAREQGGKR